MTAAKSIAVAGLLAVALALPACDDESPSETPADAAWDAPGAADTGGAMDSPVTVDMASPLGVDTAVEVSGGETGPDAGADSVEAPRGDAGTSDVAPADGPATDMTASDVVVVKADAAPDSAADTAASPCPG